MESDKHELILSYNDRNANLSVPTDISFGALTEKAAKRFKLSQSFRLEYKHESTTFSGWVEVDEESMGKLSQWGELRVKTFSDNGQPLGTNDAGTGIEGHHAEDSGTDQHDQQHWCEVCFEGPTPIKRDKDRRGCSAIFPNNRLWDKTKIFVYFLNQIPRSWSYSGHKYPIPGGGVDHIIDKDDILRLANNWSTQLPSSIHKEKREKVPNFVSVPDPLQSDIRVWFQTSGGCQSEVGTDALNVPKGSDEAHATMFLNLGHSDDRHKEHSVMHEFGHALGLGHEHQRAVFWDNIEKFFRDHVVENFFNSFTDFQTDGATLGTTPGWRSKEYDPDSIMHYWVEERWLKDEYNTLDKVNVHPRITAKEKEILRGFFKRVGTLADELSAKDLEGIAEAYSSLVSTGQSSSPGAGGQSTPVSPLPTTSLSQLDSRYLKEIVNVIWNARNRWRFFGMELDIDHATLQAIGERCQNNPDTCFHEVVTFWLQKEKSAPAFPAILSALRSPTVGFGGLARHLSLKSEEEKQKIGFYL